MTKKPEFTSLEPRQELLIRALAVVRPATSQAIIFWDQHSQPEAAYRHVTIEALADNGSELALELLEKKLGDPQHEEEEVVAWMRDPILRHRNDVAMLRVCERMLIKTLPPERRPKLVEALCDYRPDEWYLSCNPPVPPSRIEATEEARVILRRICVFAKENIPLDVLQKAGVERTLLEIRSD